MRGPFFLCAPGTQNLSRIGQARPARGHRFQPPEGFTSPVVNTVFPKTAPSPSFRSRYLFLEPADYFSDFSTLVSADKSNQHDDGSGGPESNHVRACSPFLGQDTAIRHAPPQKQCKPPRFVAKSLFLTTLRVN